MYVMITVLSETRRLRAVLKALNNAGIEGSIVLDAVGTNSLQNHYSDYKPFLESSLIAISEKARYKKMILSTVAEDALVNKAMDAVSDVLGENLKKPNVGIMFTIPMFGFVEGSQLNNYMYFGWDDM